MPIKKKNRTLRDTFGKQIEYYANVPCGKCPDCKRAIRGRWAFRLQQELDNPEHDHLAYVITLTYDPHYEFVPHSKRKYNKRKKKWETVDGGGLMTKNQYLSLNKWHLQKYIKRVRKSIKDGRKVKYFAVGEYGSLTHRPHLHIMAFGATQDELEKAWTYGFYRTDKLSMKSINYCLKYLDKENFVKQPDDDRIPEFRTMSNGIGECYLDKKGVRKAIKRGQQFQVPLNGKKIQTPRYYLDKVLGDNHWQMECRITEVDRDIQKQYEEDNALDNHFYDLDGRSYSTAEKRNRNTAKAKYTRFAKNIKIREPKL